MNPSIKNFIASITFSAFIIIWSAIVPILYSIVFFNNSSKIADHGAKVWAKFTLWMLKKLCKIDFKVTGLENVPNQPCIIACKHQSMWETIVMHLIFHHPVYAYKKELLKIPFYGWYIKRMSTIKVDRKGGVSALKDLIRQTKLYLSQGQNIIIFPQGTRVPVGSSAIQYPYQSGIAALYLNCNSIIVPAKLNSGIFWPKNSIIKKPGTITLEFCKPIESGLNKQEFMKKLEESIEN